MNADRENTRRESNLKLVKYGNIREIPKEIKVPDSGNSVLVFAEDYRYPKTGKIILDPRGREIGEEKIYPIVWKSVCPNLIVDYGRKMILWGLFGVAFTGGSPTVGGSVGDGTGHSPTDNTMNALQRELIGNSARIGLTDTTGGGFVSGDVLSETSGSNYWKIVSQFIYAAANGTPPTGDGNNGQTFAEFGMHDTTVLPTGTPPHTTNTSGNMIAWYIPTSSFPKTSAFQVTVQWTVRA